MLTRSGRPHHKQVVTVTAYVGAEFKRHLRPMLPDKADFIGQFVVQFDRGLKGKFV